MAGKAFQTLNACSKSMGREKQIKEEILVGRRKTVIKAVAEPTRMAQQAETDTSKPAEMLYLR